MPQDVYHGCVVAAFVHLALSRRAVARAAHVDAKLREFARVVVRAVAFLVAQSLLLFWAAGATPRIGAVDVAALVDLRHAAVASATNLGWLGLQVAMLLALGVHVLRAGADFAMAQRFDLATRQQIQGAGR